MKVYISASFTNRLKMRPVRDRLWALGHTVVSSWIDETVKPDFLTSHEWGRKLAEKDRAEVLSADLFLLDAEEISTGKAVELGLALGQFHLKLVWIVGTPKHLFHHLADEIIQDWETCFKKLEKQFSSHDLKDASIL
ncbi:MAG: hypothetical protein AABY22_09475 [Nanoarchaeota archaeon]